MIVTTTNSVKGRDTVEVLGLVRGSSVRARHVCRDIIAGLRNLIGGEISGYTNLLAQSREEAMTRMVEEAEGQGANAIVGMRFATSMVMGGAAEILAYGTAVVLADTDADA